MGLFSEIDKALERAKKIDSLFEKEEPSTCPARCKDTGKCYGTSYFDQKPGKALDCQGTACPWNDPPPIDQSGKANII